MQRSKHDTTDTRLLVQMTAAELDEMLERRERRVIELLDELPRARSDGPLDRAGAAAWLGCSLAKLDQLIRTDGLPFHWLGDCKRFFRSDLEAFVRARKAN